MSEDQRTPIFLTGATGYIGGSVLARLLAHPSAKSFDITVVSRRQEKADKLAYFGVKAVVSSMDYYALLEDYVAKAHIVIDCADADNIDAVQAIIRGLKKRHELVGDTPIFIHTSGTAVLSDNAKGLHPSDTVYDDMNPDQIAGIPPSAPHRNVDNAIFDADKQGYLKAYFIAPGTIYGIAHNPLVDAGIQNSRSQQIPQLVKASLDRGQAGVVGKGASLWPNVHIDDVSDLYIILFDAVTANSDKLGHGLNGFHFGENGEHRWYDISRAIGQAFVEFGISGDPEPTSFTEEELDKYFGSEELANANVGSNSRCRSNRGRSIGWKPKYVTKDMLASVNAEVEAALKLNGKK
ncbi:unnamed protein product [Somion occarium]|uniref:Saccharopine dehydrogenase NADP binding domain-containing protein n=1 Tax=Somion occarium TaxID=3059160 RepID=A0ABP1EAC9_9APHY